jgi:hypothetical protein
VWVQQVVLCRFFFFFFSALPLKKEEEEDFCLGLFISFSLLHVSFHIERRSFDRFFFFLSGLNA